MTNGQLAIWIFGLCCGYDNLDVVETEHRILDAIDAYMDKAEREYLKRRPALNCDPETNNCGILED